MKTNLNFKYELLLLLIKYKKYIPISTQKYSTSFGFEPQKIAKSFQYPIPKFKLQ